MSKQKPSLTPEEKALFEKTLGGTARLKQDKRLIKKEIKSRPITPTSSHSPPNQDFVGSYDIYLQNLTPEDWLGPEDTIHFARVGVQHRTLNKLKKGLLPMEARLDLHGMTADEAIENSTQFIEDCLNNQVRTVLIVHGKGQVSGYHGPILKNLLNRWLREQEFVLAFHSCKPKDGGAGATYVLLKRTD